MIFDDVCKIGKCAEPFPEKDPEFLRLWHAVARGEMTVDEAWKQLQAHREKVSVEVSR